MDIFRRPRQYNVSGILRSGFFGIIGKQIGDSLGRSESKAAAAAAPIASPIATPAQTVGDPTSANKSASQLGRAALISTSPSGVAGLDPTGKRKLLGND